MMEKCEEYQYKNSLNIFSITLGPFETMNKESIDLDKIEKDETRPEVANKDVGAFGSIAKVKDPNRKNDASKTNDSGDDS